MSNPATTRRGEPAHAYTATDKPTGPVEVRLVNDVDTLKALADPLRLAILTVLMRDARRVIPIRTVKELADELGEPQTKLYRHVKHLATQNLIQIAETRIVSGIVENRYRTGQLELNWDNKFLDSALASGGATDLIISTFDRCRDDFAAAIRSGRVTFGVVSPPEESYHKPISAMLSARISPDRAADFRDRMAALVDEFMAEPHEDNGIQVQMFASYYSLPDVLGDPADANAAHGFEN